MFTYNAETNEIIWDKLPIGGLDGKTIVLTANLAGPQKGKLKKYLIEQGYEIEGYRKAEGDEEPEQASEAQMPSIPTEDIPPPPVPESPPHPANSNVHVAPIPNADPQLGDKTPAVVEWYRDNDPAEYERRYKNRKTHLGRI
jgi:hypothetical protein